MTYDDEFEGVELAKRVQERDKCEHDYMITEKETYTFDGRRAIERMKECKKCGNWSRKTIRAEELKEETIRRM